MMEVKNNIKEVPLKHYLEEYNKINPDDASARCKAEFDGKAFKINFLGDTYTLTWPEFSIACENSDAFALTDLKGQTFLLRIILEMENHLFLGKYKTFREMPWGEMYIEPFTGRCLTRSAFTFGTDVAKFRKACETLGATPVDHADAAFGFEVLDGYFIQILIWEGDDEFSPSAQILYSDNFETSFVAEDRVVIAEMLITKIKATMKGV